MARKTAPAEVVEEVKEPEVAAPEPTFTKSLFPPEGTPVEGSIHENASTNTRHRFLNGEWSSI